MPRIVLPLLTGLLMLAAAPAAAQPYDDVPPAPAPWFVDSAQTAPLYAYREPYQGDRAKPLWVYPGDENTDDFADRYGCRPVWDGAVNRFVATCNAHGQAEQPQ